MKNFFIITMIIVSSLSFKCASTKSDNIYGINNMKNTRDISYDPRKSCRCPPNFPPSLSCICPKPIKNRVRENVVDRCSCSIDDETCDCNEQQRRSPLETEKMDKNSNLFLQSLWNRVVNDVGQTVTLYLLQKED